LYIDLALQNVHAPKGSNMNLENTSAFACRTTGRIVITLAFLYAAILFASFVVIPLLAPGAKIPNPFGRDDASRSFFLNNTRAIQVADLFS
jgi:hypothetical protein